VGVFDHQALKPVLREVGLNRDAGDRGAGSDMQMWLMGQVRRKAGRDRSFAFSTSHRREPKCLETAGFLLYRRKMYTDSDA
jgi:hypothetical protein